MKPISRQVGVWGLFICSYVMSLVNEPTSAAIFLVGAILVDAIKAMDKGS